MFAAVLVFTAGNALAQDGDGPRRWQLVTDGATDISKGHNSGGQAIPNLAAGTSANFLFKLNQQINSKEGKLISHVGFETGVVSVPRAVTAKADTANSPAVETLINQGSTVSVNDATATTQTNQRAFTVGGQWDIGSTIKAANGTGRFGEFGFLVRAHFDAFIDDERFFEKDGLTYVNVASVLGQESAFLRGEAGARFRVSSKEGGMEDNDGDLLVVEGLLRKANALQGLLPESLGKAENRWAFRFIASPILPGDDKTKYTRVVMGMEVSNDLKGHGIKDVKLFYGVNVNLHKLFD